MRWMVSRTVISPFAGAADLAELAQALDAPGE